ELFTAAAPDSIAAEARSRQHRQAGALLEAGVGAQRKQRRHAQLDQRAVERPVTERVDQILAPEAKTQRSTQEGPALEIGEHQVDRHRIEPGYVAIRVRIPLLPSLREIGVQTHARTEVEAIAARLRPPLQIRELEPQRGSVAMAREIRIAER